MATMYIRCSDVEHEEFKESAHEARVSLNAWVLGRLTGRTGPVPMGQRMAKLPAPDAQERGRRELPVEPPVEEYPRPDPSRLAALQSAMNAVPGLKKAPPVKRRDPFDQTPDDDDNAPYTGR